MIDIEKWCKDIADNFALKENREVLYFATVEERDAALVAFTVKALANVQCQGSYRILTAIRNRRQGLVKPEGSE